MLAKNSFKLIFANLALVILGLGSVPIIVFSVGLNEYFLIGLFTSLFAITTVVDFGIPAAAISVFGRGKLSQKSLHAEVMTLESISWLLAFIILVALNLINLSIGDEWKQEAGKVYKFDLVMAISSITISSRYLENFYRSALQGMTLYNEVSSIMAISSVIRTILGVAVVMVFPFALYYLLIQAIVSIISLFVLYKIYSKRIIKDVTFFKFDWEYLNKIKPHGASMLLLSVTALVITQYDKYFLSFFDGESYTLTMLCWNFASAMFLVYGPLGNVSLQVLSNSENKNNEAEKFERILGLYLLISMLGFGALIILRIVIPSLFPLVDHSLFPILMTLFIIGTIFNGIASLFFQLLLLNQDVKVNLYINVILCFVIWMSMSAVYEKFNFLTSGIIWMAVNIVYLTVMIPAIIIKIYGINFLIMNMKKFWIYGAILFLSSVSFIIFNDIIHLTISIMVLISAGTIFLQKQLGIVNMLRIK